MQTAPQPIELSVRYRLAEYLRLISEFEPRSATHREAIQKAKSSPWARVLPNAKWLERIATVLIGTPAFLYKRSSVGTCVFRIGPERIERQSKAGTLAKPWSSVTVVHCLSEAYLVELEHGAMPLPYRCFSPEQRAAFEAFVPSDKLGAQTHAA
jgi:hypothetical protein